MERKDILNQEDVKLIQDAFAEAYARPILEYLRKQNPSRDYNVRVFGKKGNRFSYLSGDTKSLLENFAVSSDIKAIISLGDKKIACIHFIKAFARPLVDILTYDETEFPQQKVSEFLEKKEELEYYLDRLWNFYKNIFLGSIVREQYTGKKLKDAFGWSYEKLRDWPCELKEKYNWSWNRV